jgi:membrane protein implicated in regulation of membrane protease activity
MILAAYLAATGFGVVLIGAAVLLGGHDHDMEKDFEFEKDFDFHGDVDMDADIEIEHDIDHPEGDLVHAGPDPRKSVAKRPWLPFLSMRFWTYALASGGGTGTILTLLSIPVAVHLPVALGSGLGLGWIAAWSFKKLKGATADSAVTHAALKGAEGTVVLAIRPGQMGKIRLHIQGAQLELLARSREDRILNPKEAVLIVQVTEGTAIVMPVPRLTQNPSS